MKIKLQFLGTLPKPIWRDQVEEQFNRLEAAAAIGTASVALEQRHEMKPSFRMRALLAVPGPDIHAEVREHTFQAVLRKVIDELLRQIQARKSKQLRKRPQIYLRNWSGTFTRRGV